MSELYDDLGVSPDAGSEEIKAAHRKAVKRTHPDKGGDREEFEKVQRAYMVLSDPKRRARYDRGETDADEPDNFEAGVVAIVCDCFTTAMQQGDIVFEDIIALTRELIGVKAKEIRSGIDHSKVVIDKLDAITERLSSKGDRNVIAIALAEQRRDAVAALAHLERKLEAHIKASKMCDEFEYRTDRREPRSPMPDDVWSDNVKLIAHAKLDELMTAMMRGSN